MRKKGSKNRHLLRVTTVALKDNEYLRKISSRSNMVETYCEGYEVINGSGRRKPSLDGYYFNSELKLKYVPA